MNETTSRVRNTLLKSDFSIAARSSGPELNPKTHLVQIVVERRIASQIQLSQGELIKTADHLVENVKILIALILMYNT